MTEALRSVGFVGLGNMGWPMAHNLAMGGFDLIVHDIDADRTDRFVTEHGCTSADSADAFATAEVVVTMLPDDRVVREAVLGWGLAEALAPGSLIVDMSSSNPSGTLKLGPELASLGLTLIDAPVSGGISRAAAGTLTIMVGCDEAEAAERVEPLLATLGDRVFQTGPLGSGHAMKALNNYVGATAYTATVEALAIGSHYGLRPSTMIDVFNVSTARSFNSEVVVKDHVLTGAYATGFALGLLAKDVGIAAVLANESQVDAPLCELVSSRWAEAAHELGFATDHSEAHKRWWLTDLADHAQSG